MLYGTVVQFFPARGYGFIRPDRGADVYFHVTALGACQAVPKIEAGQPVKYELEPGTDPRLRRRPRQDDDEAEPVQPVRPRAKLVELIDRLPGAVLQPLDQTRPAARHPRARKKKPTWRSGP